MPRNIIAETETFDYIRRTRERITCYEERDYNNDCFYTVNVNKFQIDNEYSGRFETFEFDTMEKALDFVGNSSGYVSPTNGGVPVFPEEATAERRYSHVCRAARRVPGVRRHIDWR